MSELNESSSVLKRKYKKSRNSPSVMWSKQDKKYYEILDDEVITDVPYEKDKGTREEVLQGIAFRTKGLLRKKDFMVTDKGSIKSLKKHKQGKISSNVHTINEQRKNKKFEFYYKNSLIFDCVLEKRTCSKEGCQMENDYPIEFCMNHLKTEMNLTIKPTTLERNVNGTIERILGHGLFAWSQEILYKNRRDNKIIFKEGDIICFYNGKKLNKKEAYEHNDETNYPHAQRPYSLFQNNKNDIVDASCLRGVGAFANHKCPSQANAKLGLRLHPQKKKTMSCLIAQKIIRNGDEIFVYYGYDPIKWFKDYQYTTTNVKYDQSW